jgi:spore maturation protein CgeB
MKILYIAPYSEGSTSKMRGESLKKILKPELFVVINTQEPIDTTARLFRSIGWRYKFGPLVERINSFILERVDPAEHFDLTWIDKGVFIKPSVIGFLRKQSDKLIHFTPDPAFTYHQSALFNKSLHMYDHCITTKSYEIEHYRKFGKDPIVCTQGYDPTLHKPYHQTNEKKGVVFIGHKEAEREEIISLLLETGIQVTLAGINWDGFNRKHRNKSNFKFKGKGLFGLEYAKEISAAKFGLGFLSKWVPELHTTRTFEIPACGTALVTERNHEISSWFDVTEAIYINNPQELSARISELDKDDTVLASLTQKGYKRVIEGKHSYESIMKSIIHQVYEEGNKCH